jgi:hypothetical protein
VHDVSWRISAGPPCLHQDDELPAVASGLLQNIECDKTHLVVVPCAYRKGERARAAQ